MKLVPALWTQPFRLVAKDIIAGFFLCLWAVLSLAFKGAISNPKSVMFEIKICMQQIIFLKVLICKDHISLSFLGSTCRTHNNSK